MNAVSLIRELESHGLQLKVMGNQLAISPAGNLTDRLRKKVKTCKAQILKALNPQSESYTPSQRRNRQPNDVNIYLTDSNTLVDVARLLDELIFICKGRSIIPTDIAQYMLQEQIDDWQNGKLTSNELKQIADTLEFD